MIKPCFGELMDKIVTFSAFLSPLSNAHTASFNDFTTSAGLFCDFPNNGILTNVEEESCRKTSSAANHTEAKLTQIWI